MNVPAESAASATMVELARKPSIPSTRGLGGTIFLLRPPYRRPHYAASWASFCAGLEELRMGAIAGIRLDGDQFKTMQIDSTIRMLRSRFPSIPIVLLLRLPADQSVLVTAMAARLHVRAVLLEDGPIADPLRHSLTQTTGLEEDVLDWFSLIDLRPSPLVLSLIHEIFCLAPHFRELSALLSAAGIPATSARFRMHKRRLPPPSRWFQAARALHVALRMQAATGLPLSELAAEWGYADHSALSQLVQRSFGVRPGVIRGTLGWEWLMERWVRRERDRNYFISARPGGTRFSTPATAPSFRPSPRPPMRARSRG